VCIEEPVGGGETPLAKLQRLTKGDPLVSTDSVKGGRIKHAQEGEYKDMNKRGVRGGERGEGGSYPRGSWRKLEGGARRKGVLHREKGQHSDPCRKGKGPLDRTGKTALGGGANFNAALGVAGEKNSRGRSKYTPKAILGGGPKFGRTRRGAQTVGPQPRFGEGPPTKGKS